MIDEIDIAQRSRFQQDIRSYESLASHDLTKKIYEESRHNFHDMHTSIFDLVPDQLRYQHLETATAISLPPVLEGIRPLQEVIHKRISTRFFAPAPIPLAKLATILKLASDGDRQDWPQEKDTGVDLQFVVVAWRVEDILPAVYCYDALTHALLPIHAAPDQVTEAQNLVLQVEFAYVPVIILITGNLAAASIRYGAWGHRQLLLRAGTASQRLWFASLGLDLAGTVFAGFLQRAAYIYAGIDGYKSAGLLAYTTGYAVDISSALK